MGELIRREAASAPLTFSGERLTSSITGQVEIEHYHRYLLAREFCRDRDVLDVAAGEGYGTALLSQVARSVVGIEIDADSVAAATREFQRANLRYEQADARALPLPDASIDVVVSFETLEHLSEQDQFLSEIHRVLRHGGLLIISTPDRDAYSPFNTAPNPFHVRELTGAEFESLLRRRFAYHTVAAQRAVIGSVILRAGQDVPLWAYEKRSDVLIEGSETFARAPYLIAFASDAPPPPLPNSVFVYRSDLDTDPRTRLEAEMARIGAEHKLSEALARVTGAEHGLSDALARVTGAERGLSEGLARAKDAEARAKDAEARAELVEQQNADARRHILHIEGRLGASQQNETHAANVIGDLARRLEAAERQESGVRHHLGLIETSTMWRLMRPFRNIGVRWPLLARNLRRLAKLVWWTLTFQLAARYRLRRDRLSVVPTVNLPPLPVQAAAVVQLAVPQPDNIVIPVATDPMVSIIISTYGQADLTLLCLKSIADHLPTCPIEVILIDDAYPGPEDVSVFAELKGVKFLRNESNQGFLRSCNRAAKSATGRYLYMLNNDTELGSGSIDALVDLLEARPDVGLVGSKLLFPDGRLQEAGGILWSDASGWNFGRGEDAARPEYNYVREVDYCSGASLMVSRQLFESLGGFDTDLAPAYYEDVDLAIRVRARGLKVLYEPQSVIVHHEGMSHGTDLMVGVKAHQVINQARIKERWGSVLQREHFEGPSNLMRARDHDRARKTILVVDHYVPEPDRDAGSRSAVGIIDSLIDAGWIVKFWPHNRLYSSVYTVALERRGVEVVDLRWPGDIAAWLRENGATLDHLLIIRPHIAAEILPHISGNTDAVLSFYGVDLHCARLRRQAAQPGQIATAELLTEAARWEAIERGVWRRVDVVIYPSEEEAEAVQRMSPRSLARGIVPFCFPMFPARVAPPKGCTILFVAGFAHPPNADAAAFLIRDILPLLEQDIGPVSVILAGSHPTEAVKALAGPRIEVTGYVSDETLSALYEQQRVAIVPLRFGAGVKGKVVEALSHGLPLVTTSTGAQGIPGLEAVVPVHDDVVAIVEALKSLLTDDDAWMRQSLAQSEFAQRRFSSQAMQTSVLAALEAGEEAVRGHVTPPVPTAQPDTARSQAG